MITGYNTNIEHSGNVYHVQTEVQGGAHPIVETLVYQGGTIINSKKTPYDHLYETETPEAEIKNLAEKQHKQMITLIKSGKLPEYLEHKNKIDAAGAGKNSDGMNKDDHKRYEVDNTDHHISGDEQITTKIQMNKSSDLIDLETSTGNSDGGDRKEKSPDQIKREDESKTEKKYVSGTKLKRSIFLEKIEEQTDRMQSTKFSRDLETKSQLILKIRTILDDISNKLKGVQAVSLHLKNVDIDVMSPVEQNIKDFFGRLPRVISSIQHTLDINTQFGQFEEHIIITRNVKIVTFNISPDSLLTLVLIPSVNIEDIRRAITPYIRRLREVVG